jgi:hypothetical protein
MDSTGTADSIANDETTAAAVATASSAAEANNGDGDNVRNQHQ